MVDSFLVNVRFGIEVGGGEALRFTFVQPNKARAWEHHFFHVLL